ncbi:hypothetical protein SSP35_04_04220 [Streptomyces sp. NBRC 110611]|uniref:hypothetical protein n=1 Tax=Streptomyces sp. NBRC 110611 TaxID=1621259 RepID=UPI000857F851|nr:hypothetical protein [Streptomyces sp. NBRC 110611]GAU67334.1 hypothetical protein SSP35_04_04220 [Streptomyces sp. NBRC 110611]
MAQVIRKLAIGAALSIACVSCTANGEGDAPVTPSPVDQFTPLDQLKPINLDGDPLSGAETFDTRPTPRALGEVSTERYRMIVYTQGSSCGLLVVDAKTSQRPLINLVSAWPKNVSEGSQRYAAGPYNFASGAGSESSRSRASLYCSEKAMVVEFTPGEEASTSGQQGHVSTKKRHSDPESLVVVTGSDAARKRIMKQL